MGGPLDTMRSLEQFLPGDQPRGFMGPDSGPKGQFLQITFFQGNMMKRFQKKTSYNGTKLRINKAQFM